jgi:hypothetical protein
MSKEFWVADSYALMDMRKLEGPFTELVAAIAAANRRPSEPHREREHRAMVDSWYAVHPKGGMVDGPHADSATAETRRQANIADEECFNVACAEDKGFTARIVYLTGGTFVLERAA